MQMVLINTPWLIQILCNAHEGRTSHWGQKFEEPAIGKSWQVSNIMGYIPTKTFPPLKQPCIPTFSGDQSVIPGIVIQLGEVK